MNFSKKKQCILKLILITLILLFICIKLFSVVNFNKPNNKKEKDNIELGIILSVYNGEKYIQQTVESILDQTFKNLILIVVDDGSTDKTLEILENLKNKTDRMKLICHYRNLGVSQGRNTGLKYLKDLDLKNLKYFTFIDADDFLEQTCYETCFHEIQLEQKEVDVLVYGIKDESSNFIFNENKIYNFKDIFFLKTDFIKEDYGTVWNKLYSKRFINIRFPERVNPYEELAFNFTVFANCRLLKTINSTFYFHRLNNQQSVMKNVSNYERVTNWTLSTRHIFLNWEKYNNLCDENISCLIEYTTNSFCYLKNKIDFTYFFLIMFGKRFDNQIIKKCSKETQKNIYELTNGKFGYSYGL